MSYKRIINLALLFTIISFKGSFSATPATGYDLRFKIKGLKDTLCYIANYYGDKQYLKDSAKVDAQGNIAFKGKEALPGGIYLFVFPNKTYFEFLIDKVQAFSMEGEQDNIIGTMKVKGSEDNALFYQYLQFIQDKSKIVEPLKSQRKATSDLKQNTDSIDNAIKVIDKQVADYKTQFVKDHPGTLLSIIFNASEEVNIPDAPVLANGQKDSTFAYRYYKQHYFDNFDLSEERLLRTPIYHNKLSSYFKNLVVQIPDSIIKDADMVVAKAEKNKETFKYVIWYLTNTYETSNIMGLDTVFVYLVKHYYTKEKAYWVDAATLYKIQDRANILDPILIGRTAKNLVLADTSGNYQSLYAVKSPYTILYFWDPDCGHCKKATPKVHDYFEKVKSKGVNVFAINTAVEEKKWKDYIKENNLEWINVADLQTKNNFRHEFDIQTTPQIFILDKDKKIIAKKIDEDTLEKILDKELEKNIKN